MPVPPERSATFCLYFQATSARRTNRRIDEMVGRVWLASVQERGGIEVPGVVAVLVHGIVPLRVEDGRFVQICVKT